MRKQSFTPQLALRQFKRQARKVNDLLRTGSFEQLPEAERGRILHRLRQLYRALQLRFGQRRLQRVLAGAALLLGLGVNTAQAQVPTWTGPTQNPFGLTAAGAYFIQPEVADMDADGDLDIFIGDGHIRRICERGIDGTDQALLWNLIKKGESTVVILLRYGIIFMIVAFSAFKSQC